MRRRQFKQQFRVVWRYKGQKQERQVISDNPSTVLRMLRRVGTTTPWMGTTTVQFRRAWAWLMRRLNVPFEAVAEIPPKNVLLQLQASFPQLEYIRVESRQVAPWVAVIDPLLTLQTAGTAKADAKKLATLKMAEQLAAEGRLDEWRWRPDLTRDRYKRTL